MPNDVAAEKAGSTEHGDGATVRCQHDSNSPVNVGASHSRQRLASMHSSWRSDRRISSRHWVRPGSVVRIGRAASSRGATITLSNFGMIGGRFASLVVGPPQVAQWDFLEPRYA